MYKELRDWKIIKIELRDWKIIKIEKNKRKEIDTMRKEERKRKAKKDNNNQEGEKEKFHYWSKKPGNSLPSPNSLYLQSLSSTFH